MHRAAQDAPTPTLRIIPVEHIYPHEVHDPQRAAPLIERISKAKYLTNPIIVAPIGDNERYVVLDGANRYHTFSTLGYKRILAQVVDYTSPHVDLHIWQHIVSHCDHNDLITEIQKTPDASIINKLDPNCVARLIMRDGTAYSLDAKINTLTNRNAILRNLVASYQAIGNLHRTAANDPREVWSLYPKAIALVQFPQYQPEDILKSAENGALLPPGVSRHIIHGRALRVNYPMADLLDDNIPLDIANRHLQTWIQAKLEKRAIRYYAESTYQFDE